MRLGLTYDVQRDATDEREAEFDPPGTVTALCAALHELGHDIQLIGNARELLGWCRQRPNATMDLIFNIAEGTHGRCREAWVPTLLELWGIPYVGSDPLALSLGLDKLASKRLAVASGIPTPAWIAVDHPRAVAEAIPIAFPVVVKPRYQGSGIGIDEGAVVHDRAGLARRVEWLFGRWPKPLLIEELVPYGEVTVHVIGNDPPIAYPPIQRALDPVSRLSCHVVRSGPKPW
ncbi:MAG: D-alanine--D-alanine ligase, partial [Candidatus Omnitrophica bacterium]|nr:D-alanine--D-alanine ligase [Candidatus Omnitrophota bacterium]